MVMAWGLPDENSPAADAFLQGVDDQADLWIPALFWYELANALCAARRRGRITAAEGSSLASAFSRLPLKLDVPTGATPLQLAGLAHSNSLSAYDAAYLELALRKGTGLATLDGRLARAASQAGVEVAP